MTAFLFHYINKLQGIIITCWIQFSEVNYSSLRKVIHYKTRTYWCSVINHSVCNPLLRTLTLKWQPLMQHQDTTE